MRHTNRSLRRLSPRIIIFSLVIVAIITGVGSFVLNQLSNGNAITVWWVSWLQDFSVGMLGAAITFWLINILFGGQREREAKEQAIRERKEQLIRQLASTVNAEAIRAAKELRASGWLEDGTLEGAVLDEANLQGADLNHAKLSWASLKRANLQEAILDYTDLKGSDLSNADLRKAKFLLTDLGDACMDHADLREASFEYANLQGASLWVADARKAYFADANLRRAVLSSANLEGAFLNRASIREAHFYYHPRCNESTILPDETHWQTNDDLKKFIDPTHPEFFEVVTPYWHERNDDKTSE